MEVRRATAAGRCCLWGRTPVKAARGPPQLAPSNPRPTPRRVVPGVTEPMGPSPPQASAAATVPSTMDERRINVQRGGAHSGAANRSLQHCPQRTSPGDEHSARHRRAGISTHACSRGPTPLTRRRQLRSQLTQLPLTRAATNIAPPRPKHRSHHAARNAALTGPKSVHTPPRTPLTRRRQPGSVAATNAATARRSPRPSTAQLRLSPGHQRR
ncbi:hypothetical protein FB470_003241 [Amycolatopsis thermophila]|uniref:Uncharacterized protein n=1 Tax=Amycolatopsis thermophila TaxID=206084 RepID=A0ABU0EVB8_9PSEU|nr:hypothetical protein [Amycolatopsis thermophila]